MKKKDIDDRFNEAIEKARKLNEEEKQTLEIMRWQGRYACLAYDYFHLMSEYNKLKNKPKEQKQ